MNNSEGSMASTRVAAFLIFVSILYPTDGAKLRNKGKVFPFDFISVRYDYANNIQLSIYLTSLKVGRKKLSGRDVENQVPELPLTQNLKSPVRQ